MAARITVGHVCEGIRRWRWCPSRQLDRKPRSQTDFSLPLRTGGRSIAPRRHRRGIARRAAGGEGRARAGGFDGELVDGGRRTPSAVHAAAAVEGGAGRRAPGRKRVQLPCDEAGRAVAARRRRRRAGSRPAARGALRRRRGALRPRDPGDGVEGATLAGRRRRAGGRPRPAQPRRWRSRCGPRSSERPRLVVVGAGFIGCEVAQTARKLGLEVTLIDIAATPMSPLGPSAG